MAKKILIAVILFAAILVGGTGCMIVNRPTTGETKPSTNDVALAYMEQKYGESFTYTAPWGDSMTGTREILVTCSSLPGQPVLVQVENFRGEEPIFRDNYLAVKYQAETANYLRGLAQEIFGQANVYHEASKQSVSSELPTDASFETFYADASTVIIATIELKSSSYSSRQQLEDLLAKLAASQGQVMISVIVVEDAVYGTLDRRGLDQLVYKGEEIAFVYAETRGGSFQVNWSGEE